MRADADGKTFGSEGGMDFDSAMDLARDGAVGVAEACRFLGVSRSQLYEIMAQSELAYVKVGTRRLLLLAELRRFLAVRRVGG